MTNKTNHVLYTGVTSNLVARIQQHRNEFFEKSFTSKYKVYKLVYYESYSTIEVAILEEKRIKGGNRERKIALINSKNKDWIDLWTEIEKW